MRNVKLSAIIMLIYILLLGHSILALADEKDLGNIGSFEKWSKVEISISGPNSIGMSETPNPFKIIVDVIFTGPEGETFLVPAFYDGNGAGGLDGNIWRARLTPNAIGQWSFISTSSNGMLDGYIGTFDVTSPTGCQPYKPGSLPDFSCVGHLEYIGEHYLKFADGGYWLKGGTNDPEDFLAPSQTAGFNSKEEAIDYLVSKGVNALYFMSNNVGGDQRNVWPWVGTSESEAQTNHEHFDVAKLAEWENILTYLQENGIVLHFVFEDDSGWTGFNRSLYYRQLVARFGHHNGLIWNIAEEYNENYLANEVKSYAQLLSDLDAYNHPVTVLSRWDVWGSFLGNENFDLTCFHSQDFPATPENGKAEEWFYLVENSGRTIPTSWDEITRGLYGNDRDEIRHIIWASYMGGANVEIVTKSNVDYQQFDLPFEDMTRARAFLEDLPFWEMRPENSLVTSGEGYVFHKPAEIYCVYLPSGGQIDLDLSATTNSFDGEWFDPRGGSTQGIGEVQGGSIRFFVAPDANDWVLLLKNSSSEINAPPTAENQSVTTPEETEVDIILSYSDPDGGPGPYTFTIVTHPTNGILTDDDGDALVIYTPDAGFTGTDSFTFRVNDGLDDSNEATVMVTALERGIYFPPPGESLAEQSPKTSEQVGLSPSIISDIESVILSGRWALWRHGYLVHLVGNFNANSEIKSVRKTIHAATVGAAIQRGLIPSLNQTISVWNPELTGVDADATWFHLLTQTSAFDEPTLPPGSLWAYSDANPFQLNRALARVWGYSDFTQDYDAVVADAVLDPIGAQGWSSQAASDGIRFQMDLEDLGRVGLLMVAAGNWDGGRIIPAWFAHELITKQTYGIPPNYDNSNDGHTGLQVEDFPESPYGLMTWVNTDQDLYPAAGTSWAVGFGAGGHHLAFNPSSGIVLAIQSGEFASIPGNPPGWPTSIRIALETIDNNILGPNPLVPLPDETPPSAPSGLGASVLGQTVTLSWFESFDPESGVIYYRIYRGDTPGGPKSQVAQVGGFLTAFDDTSTAPYTDYFFEVTAVNGAYLEGDSSNEVAATTGDNPPAAPLNLSALGSDGQVSLDWADNMEPDLAGYRCYRAEVTGGPYTEISGLIVASSYLDTAVVNGTSYYYVVTAEDTGGQESVFSTEASATPSAAPPPVAYWRFDEGAGPVAADAVGSSDGTVVGAGWVAGVSGTALDFDGVDDHVSVADNAALDFSSWSEATVVLWVRPEQLGTADDQTLYGHWNASSSMRPFQVLLTTGDRWQCRSNHNDGLATSVSSAMVGEWTHVACVWTPGGLSIYVDGLAEATDSSVQSYLDANAGRHTFGVRDKSGALSQFFSGALDEVRIYDRALTTEEIGLLANLNQPPFVDAGADVTIYLPATTVALDGAVTDDGQPIPVPTTFWSGPPGVSFDDPSAVDTVATFPGEGTYLLQLTADDTEFQVNDTVTVVVGAAPVLTTIVVTPAQVALSPGATQLFSAAGADQYGDPFAVEPGWSATGGSIDQTGAYTAGAAGGVFTVTATAGAVSGSATVTISGSPPVADAGGPYSVDEGSAILLDGSGSTDANNDIVGWAWDFDNDGAYDDASGESVSFSSTDSGVFPIGLRVSDAEGATDTDSATVTVDNVWPRADAGGPYSGDQDSEISLNGSGSTDPGNDILAYDWDLDDDGVYDDASGETVSFSSPDFGVFTVGLRVSDADGATDTASATVTVDDVAPAVPLNLSALGSDGRVSLDWADNMEPDLAGYRCYRAEVTGGPYTEISGLIIASSYLDTAVVNGTSYYYVVTAEDTGGQESVFSTEASATPSAAPPPVAYWRFDEGAGPVAADAVGSSDGTVVGAGWVAGVGGTALDFDGVDDQVSVADNAALDFSSWSEATVVLWVRPEQLGTADDQTLYGHWNASSSMRPFQVLLTTGDRWQCRSNHNDGLATSVSSAMVGEWTHVACVWTPGGLSIYVDGLAEATDSSVQSYLDANAGRHTFGVRDKSGALSQFFSGALDEVRIYDRALTAEEIGLLANLNQPPFVDAGADVTIYLPATTVALDGAVTDDGQPIPVPTTFWSGPPGVSFDDPSAVDTVATFPGEGTYLLQLTADDTEFQVNDTVTVVVGAAPVLTTIVVTPAQVALSPGATQLFSAAGADQYGDPFAVEPGWSATGGSIDQTGAYTAGAAGGVFTVTATAGAVSGSATVTISGSPPVADAGGPYSVDEGSAILLDGSGSTDANNDIVGWAWDFDNDGAYDDASGESVSFSSTDSGVFPIGLRVSDAEGATDTDSATVTVDNVWPRADAGGPYSGDQDSEISLDGSGSTDPGNDILAYDWDLDDDGVYDDASGETVSFSSPDFGVFTVGLRVSDADGATDTASATVTVDDVAPAVPLNLSALGSDGRVSLDWADNMEPDLAGYRCYRAEVTGGPYTEISGLIVASSYLDTAVVNGTSYYYVVTAEDTGGQESVFSTEASATPSAAPPPVAYWRFDEGAGPVAADAVGSSDGTVVGAGWVAGVSGTALDFDGVDDHVSVADNAALDFSSWSEATVVLWVRPEQLGTADDQTLYGHWNASSSMRPFQVLLTTGDRWQCRSNHNDGLATSVSSAMVGEWTHVACVWTPGGLSIYVDGLAEASDSRVQSSLDDNGGLHTIGAREKSGSFSQFFNGGLDEVRIYDRALTAEEIDLLTNF